MLTNENTERKLREMRLCLRELLHHIVWDNEGDQTHDEFNMMIERANALLRGEP